MAKGKAMPTIHIAQIGTWKGTPKRRTMCGMSVSWSIVESHEKVWSRKDVNICHECEKLDKRKHQDEAPPMGFKVVARRKVADHLDVVIAQLDDECVTWMHNTQSGGYGHGHYGQTIDQNDFFTR